MARTRELMLNEPGMFMRMFRDLDPSFESRVWPFAGLRKALADFPWMPELEMKERDHHFAEFSSCSASAILSAAHDQYTLRTDESGNCVNEPIVTMR